MPKKRKHGSSGEAQQNKRPYTDVDRKRATIYERLADESNEVRIQAAQDLLHGLSPQNNTDKLKDIENALRRLIRGLCSGRKAARFGFFIALTELLRALYGNESKYNSEDVPSIKQTLEKFETLTQPEGKVHGQVRFGLITTISNCSDLRQERRDHLFGRVSAYKAVTQSAILHRPGDRLGLFKQFLGKVFPIARDVPWLRQECGMMLCDAVNDLDSPDYATALLCKLVEHGLAKTPEGIVIWLAVRSKDFGVTFPTKIWHKNDPLNHKERAHLARVLKESGQELTSQDEDPQRLLKSGAWHAHPNFAWLRVLNAVLARCDDPSDASSSPDYEQFERFWTQFVDENLFAQSSSDERKLWGLQIFSKMVASAPAWALPALFSANLMRCVINQRAEDQRALYDAAAEPFKKMHSRAKMEPQLTAIFVASLVTKNGTLLFDRATKTKAVEELLLIADNTAMLTITQLYESLLLRSQADDEQSAESSRQSIADMLLNTARNRNKREAKGAMVQSPTQWLLNVIQIFSRCAYCLPTQDNITKQAVPPLSNKTRTVFQTRLSSLLAHMMSIDSSTNWPGIAVEQIRVCTNASNLWRLASGINGPTIETLEKVYRTFDGLGTPHGGTAKGTDRATNTLKLLLSLAMLQVFGEDPDAVSILEELEDSSAVIATAKAGSEAKIDAIVEVLLSFVSRPSALFRKVVEQVFGAITSLLTYSCIQSLIEVLQKRETVEGQDELFDHQDDGEDDDLKAEIASDVEVEEGNDSNDSLNSGDDDDDGENEQDEDECDGELMRFDSLLAETLGTSRLADQVENDDYSTDEESDMDDDQMMAMEPQLAKIFQQRRAASAANKKKEQHDAKENMVNFKSRVLDLLGIFLRQERENSLVLNVILPLLRLMRQTSSPQVANKASDILKAFFEVCHKNKSYPIPVNVDQTWLLLRDVHGEAKQQASKQHDITCSRASLLIVRGLINIDRTNYRKASSIYAETQTDWFADRKVNIEPKFFTEWVSWSAEIRKRT